MSDGDDAVNYPQPAWDDLNFGPKLDLDALPDPPDEYNPIGYTKLLRFTSQRRPTKKDALRWRRFYFWGIKYEWGRCLIAAMEVAFRKLLWYTAPHHQPRDWDEWDAMLGDAGPRTIDYTKIPWNRSKATLQRQGLLYMPVSRHFAQLPDENGPLPAYFHRPANAPAHWSDAMVYQSEQIVRLAFTSVPRSAYRRRPMQQAGTTNPNTATASAGNDSDSDAETAPIPTGPALSMEAGQHQGTVQEVKEAVERAILKVAYAGLERHPDAALREPPRAKIVTTETDILRSTICSTMANSHVRLRVDEVGHLFIDHGGVSWALKGRGPVYTNDSSVIDCMITAGVLLDAGSTNADRCDAHWEARLNGLQRAFIELCDANWDLCSPETGAQMKGALVQMVQHFVPQFGDQTPDAVALLWKMVAQHLGQFALKFDQTSTPCRCSAAPETFETKQACYMAPQFQREDATGVVMQTLFERTFQARQISRCAGCGEEGDVLERSFHPLPLRMAVTLDPRVSILDHTKDVNVIFRTPGEVEPNTHATYRWLGGIYKNGEGAYRVFWNDTRRGEMDHGRVCQYDPAFDGLIVSEELQDPPEEHRVPPQWWYNKPLPLLFYERVMNPSGDLLKAARNTIREMWNDYTMGIPTLDSHEPWRTTEHVRPSKSDYPWHPFEVVKPPDAQRFHAADAPYAPPWPSNSRTVS
ncbi:hypothetical protein BJX63DRAFT_396330 [Aspergillus granulosus]|uniref:Uncharacterized protein n=1 Tax=Aspergillus granulosus TaxID=176169 RepID=A0ABR4HAL4_9EURO